MKIDINSADEYFSTRLNSEMWFELEDKQKLAAITTAYQTIKNLPFIGTKLRPEQDEIFPRYYKGYVIQLPDDVIKGVFEEAYSLLIKSQSGLCNIPEGIQSVSLGSASMTLNGNINSKEINQTSRKFLDNWLKKGFDIESGKFREVY